MSIKNKIDSLKDAIQLKSNFVKQDLNALEETVVSSQRYVDLLVSMGRTISIARFRLEGEEYRARITAIDQSRRHAHESLMAQFTMINRMANLYGLDDIFVFNSREEAAEIAKKVVDEYFESGRNQKQHAS